MFFEKCVLLIYLFRVVLGQTIGPIVKTSVGSIEGLRADDGDYLMFLGIPFGQVDLDNPFGVAKPYPAFKKTFEAFNDPPVCPQVEEFKDSLAGSIDCLNLNIFVPNSATSLNRLPVFFWIYGGGFINGSGNRYLYGPRFLVRHDIIVVTINYRLGPYGFMCLDTPEIPGNQGLKDQQLALRWVHENIGVFGGDPNKITIAGESAGAVSVDMHLLSNREKLFDKVIIQSATALSPVFREPVRDAPIVLAEYLGYSTNNIDKALNFLTKANSQLVMQAVKKLGLDDYFRPCIEKEFNGVESFLTENWITANIPKIKNMPVLIGFNSDELYFLHTSEEDEYYQNLNSLKTFLSWGFDTSAEDFKGMEDIVRHFYFGDAPMTAAVKRGVIDFESDFLLVHPTYRSVSKYLDNEAGNIFLYVFSYVGERNYLKHYFNLTEATGAAHCDETGYLFDISYMKKEPINLKDQMIIDQTTTMLANFVKFGDPTPEVTELLPVQWTPVTNNSVTPCLNIDFELRLERRPFTQRVTFWDLFYRANAHLQIAYPGAKIDIVDDIQKPVNPKTEL